MDMTVTADRIPHKGETLSGSTLSYIAGGKGANQAVSMAKLGAEVEMFGCVGTDSAGKTLIANLESFGIRTGNIRKIEGVPTGIALITVAEDDNTIIVVAGANAHVDIAYVDSVKEEILASDMVLLQHEIPLETVEYVIRLCHAHGVKVLLNPAPAAAVSQELVEKVTYLTPNEHEAQLIFGDRPVEEVLRQYPEKLIVTQGSRGVSVCLKDGTLLNVPAIKAQVVDTTGAGDTLNGAFAVRMTQGASIGEALRFANAAASLSIEKFGAQSGMPVLDEVQARLVRN